MFGKMMSIPDELMWSYYELVTDRTPQEIESTEGAGASGTVHPMDVKMRLAEEVVGEFQGADAGAKSGGEFPAGIPGPESAGGDGRRSE